MINITVNRRRSVLALFQTYAEEAIGKGASPKGLAQTFATRLEISTEHVEPDQIVQADRRQAGSPDRAARRQAGGVTR